MGAIAKIFTLFESDVTGYGTALPLSSDKAGSEIGIQVYGDTGVVLIRVNGFVINNGYFESVTISGAIGLGSSDLEFDQCIFLNGVSGLDGIIRNSTFKDTVYLAENANMMIVNSFTHKDSGTGAVVFDFGETTNIVILSLRNYSGAVTLRNINTATKFANLGMSSGRIIIESSCTNGRVGVAGVPSTGLTDNSSGTVVQTDLLLAANDTLVEITSQLEFVLELLSFGGMVVIDTQHGEAGTAFPIGTHEHPSNNFTDAMTIASSRNIEKIHTHNTIYVDQDITGFVIEGKSGKEAIVLQNVNTDGCYFINCYLAGMSSGGAFRGERCAITANFYGLNGAFTNCGIVGDCTVVGETPTVFTQCFALAYDRTTPRLIMGAIDDLTPYYVNFRGFYGSLIIENMSGPDQLLTLGMAGGCHLTFEDTNTAGVIQVGGVTLDSIIDNSLGTTVEYCDIPASHGEVQAIIAIISQLSIADGEVLAKLGETSKQIVRDAMSKATTDTPEIGSIDNIVERIDMNTQK